jgi:hypothetical protein
MQPVSLICLTTAAFLSGLVVFPAADFHPLSRPGTSDRFATVTARGIQRPTNV